MFTTASYIFFCNFPFLERDERSSERFPVTLNNSCWKRSAAAAVFVVVGYCFSVSSSSSYRLFIWQVFFSFFLTECPFVAAWPCCRPCSQQTQTDTHTHTHTSAATVRVTWLTARATGACGSVCQRNPHPVGWNTRNLQVAHALKNRANSARKLVLSLSFLF